MEITNQLMLAWAETIKGTLDVWLVILAVETHKENWRAGVLKGPGTLQPLVARHDGSCDRLQTHAQGNRQLQSHVHCRPKVHNFAHLFRFSFVIQIRTWTYICLNTHEVCVCIYAVFVYMECTQRPTNGCKAKIQRNSERYLWWSFSHARRKRKVSHRVNSFGTSEPMM